MPASSEAAFVKAIWSELERYFGVFHPNADVSLLKEAYHFSADRHKGQQRASGEPYIIHPTECCKALAELHMDEDTLIAALLHDVLEDTVSNEQELEQLKAEIIERFGEQVLFLIEAVTKLSKRSFANLEAWRANVHKHILSKMVEDVRVILIKLADRLVNLRTLCHLSDYQQKRTAHESYQFFVPLAAHLGIFSWKWEIEDLAFMYSRPREYIALRSALKERRQERLPFVLEVRDRLKSTMVRHGLDVRVDWEERRIYSIQKRLERLNVDINDFSELYFIKVYLPTDNIVQCFTALGLVHELYPHQREKLIDFIHMPKPNSYQALQTTVTGGKGDAIEIHILTDKMALMDQIGVLSKFMDLGRKRAGEVAKGFQPKIFEYIRQLEKDTHGTEDFMASFIEEFSGSSLMVYTPKLEAIELPAGSTVLDFAYQIHTSIGHRARHGRIQGKQVPLNHQLENYAVVEIVTKELESPQYQWLCFVRTSRARSSIKQFLKAKGREGCIALGKRLMKQQVEAERLQDFNLLTEQRLLAAFSSFNFDNVEEFFEHVGRGDLVATDAFNVLKVHSFEDMAQKRVTKKQREKRRQEEVKADLIVHDLLDGNFRVKLAKCCWPIPGDVINSIYNEKSRLLTVHRAECHNLFKGEKSYAHYRNTDWNPVPRALYPAKLNLTLLERPGAMAMVSSVLADLKLSIFDIGVQDNENLLARLYLIIKFHNHTELERTVEELGKLEDIIKVERPR